MFPAYFGFIQVNLTDLWPDTTVKRTHILQDRASKNFTSSLVDGEPSGVALDNLVDDCGVVGLLIEVNGDHLDNRWGLCLWDDAIALDEGGVSGGVELRRVIVNVFQLQTKVAKGFELWYSCLTII